VRPPRALGYAVRMAGRAAPPPEREDVHDQVVGWRRHVLMDAGYPAPVADALAKGSADLHVAVDLLQRGCSPELAERILN
jgi:hypothetical protein